MSFLEVPAAEGLTRRPTLGWPALAHLGGGGGGQDRPARIVLGNQLENAFRRQIRRVPSPGFNPLCPGEAA